MNLIENGMIEAAIAPYDSTGVTSDGAWLSLRNYGHLTLVLLQGAWAGGTPAVVLDQALDASGTGEKSLPFAWRWQKPVGDSLFTKLAVNADTFPLPNAPQTLHVLELDQAALDTTSGFWYLRVRVASPGANANLLTAVAILTLPDARQVVLPSGKA